MNHAEMAHRWCEPGLNGPKRSQTNLAKVTRVMFGQLDCRLGICRMEDQRVTNAKASPKSYLTDAFMKVGTVGAHR